VRAPPPRHHRLWPLPRQQRSHHRRPHLRPRRRRRRHPRQRGCAGGGAGGTAVRDLIGCLIISFAGRELTRGAIDRAGLRGRGGLGGIILTSIIILIFTPIGLILLRGIGIGIIGDFVLICGLASGAEAENLVDAGAGALDLLTGAGGRCCNCARNSGSKDEVYKHGCVHCKRRQKANAERVCGLLVLNLVSSTQLTQRVEDLTRRFEEANERAARSERKLDHLCCLIQAQVK